MGFIPSNPVETESMNSRAEQVSLGRVKINQHLSEDFLLVIKHNALFTALLRDLRKVLDVMRLSEIRLRRWHPGKQLTCQSTKVRFLWVSILIQRLNLTLMQIDSVIDRQL